MNYPFNDLLGDFPLITDGKIIYLDSATKTLFPPKILEAIRNFYIECGLSPRRGAHKLSIYADTELEKSRTVVARLVNAERENIVFTPNLPVSAATLISGYPWKKGDKILISNMEHNSILAPTLYAKRNFGLELSVVNMDEEFKFDINDLEKKIDDSCKLLLLTFSPMILGVHNPLREAAEIAHEHGCDVISDFSRGIVHSDLNFNNINCDALLFSSCIGITGMEGASAICAKKDFLEKIEPSILGGGSIKEASYEEYKVSALPDRLEPGLVNMASIIGLREAVNYLQNIGLDRIRAYNRDLTQMCVDGLKETGKVRLYGPLNKERESPMISFNIEGFNCHDTALFLDEAGKIIARSGMQCTYPLATQLDKKGLVQVSFHFYNTPEQISIFLDTVNLIISELS